MAQVINLRRARKARARANASATADANRAAFGRSKADKQAQAAEAARLSRTLDGALRDD